MFNPLDYTVEELSTTGPAKGKVLIAEPFMADPYFKRSVVLITDYSEKEISGFILNKSVGIKLKDIININEFNASVNVGGPVTPDSLYYIHTKGLALEGSTSITDDLYFGGNFEQLQELIAARQINSEEILFFMGYAGWGYDQLQEEMKSGSWIVTDLKDTSIKALSKQSLWQDTLKNMGTQQAVLSNFPEDPSLN